MPRRAFPTGRNGKATEFDLPDPAEDVGRTRPKNVEWEGMTVSCPALRRSSDQGSDSHATAVRGAVPGVAGGGRPTPRRSAHGINFRRRTSTCRRCRFDARPAAGGAAHDARQWWSCALVTVEEFVRTFESAPGRAIYEVTFRASLHLQAGQGVPGSSGLPPNASSGARRRSCSAMGCARSR